MNLTIDIGNTSSKYAIFNKKQTIASGNIPQDDIPFYKFLLNEYPIQAVIVSTVKSPLRKRILEIFYKKGIRLTSLNHNTSLPFINCYETPSTIGLDRLAAVAGAISHYPNENLLIIDAGTAITYDLINTQKEFLGGNISPGLQMRFKAVNYFTKKLPLLSPTITNLSLIGKSTGEAINNGILNGLIFEVDGMINEFKQRYSNLRIVFTGGDAFFFDSMIKNPIFVHPNLVLEGLNSILEYNAKI